jgi:tetratricopeptide (TPR) repeat protein
MLGHPERALEAQDREIAALRRLYGERSLPLSFAMMNKGVTLTMMSQYELAIPVLHDAIDLLESVGGSGNPQLELFYDNLGSALLQDRRLDEARTAFRHALSVEGDRPPGSLTMDTLGGLATVETLSEHPLAALEYVRKGIQAAEPMGDDGAKYTVLLIEIRGEAHLRMGDAAGAVADCRSAVSMQEAQGLLEPNAIYWPDALRCLGEGELALGHVRTAIEHLERSISLEHRNDLTDLASARFALARALSATGRDPARAAALAQGARATYAGRARFETEVAAIDRWLSGR